MNCPKCKKELPPESRYCMHCGRALTGKSVPAKVHKRANGTGTAIKRGKTWAARIIIGYDISEDGKHKRQKSRMKCGFKTKTEALEYCAALKQRTDEDNTKKVPKLSQYWDMYYNNELSALSTDKQTAYKKAWSRLEPLHDRYVNVITVSDLRQAVSASANTYYTCRDCKVVLSHLFKLAAADGFASKDLPSFIKLPKLQEKERQPFTEEEQQAIWAQWEAGNKDAAMPLIMIYTGMMPGQLIKLHSDMVDLQQRQIVGVGLKTEVRKASPIYIPVAIMPIMEEMTAKGGKLFPYNKDNVYKRYYAVLDAAGTRHLSPYSCRHTTATALSINMNVAPDTVRKIMRWSSTKMLSRYAHPDSSAVFDAIDKFHQD